MVDEALIFRKLSELDEYFKLKKDLDDFMSYKEAIINFIKAGNAT